MAYRHEDYDGDYDPYDDDRSMFADPGGGSALRATNNAGGRCGACRKRVGEHDHFCKHCGVALNPRVHPCPECGRPGLLTDEDVRRGYRCNRCAGAAERGVDAW